MAVTTLSILTPGSDLTLVRERTMVIDLVDALPLTVALATTALVGCGKPGELVNRNHGTSRAGGEGCLSREADALIKSLYIFNA